MSGNCFVNKNKTKKRNYGAGGREEKVKQKGRIMILQQSQLKIV